MPKGDEICFPNPTVKSMTDLDLDAQVVIRTSVKLVIIPRENEKSPRDDIIVPRMTTYNSACALKGLIICC